MEALFWKRSEEFRKLLQQMGDLPDVSSLPLARLTTLHEEYDHLFKTALEKKGDLSNPAFQDPDEQIRRRQEELIQLVEGISRDARKDQNEKSLKTLSVGHSAFWTTAGLSMGALLLGIVIALVITRNISRSIRQLKRSTQEISGGKFDHLPEVPICVDRVSWGNRNAG